MLAPLIHFNNWVILETQNSIYLNYSLNTNHLALSVSLKVSLVWPLVHSFGALGMAVPHRPFCRLES